MAATIEQILKDIQNIQATQKQILDFIAANPNPTPAQLQQVQDAVTVANDQATAIQTAIEGGPITSAAKNRPNK